MDRFAIIRGDEPPPSPPPKPKPREGHKEEGPFVASMRNWKKAREVISHIRSRLG